MPDHRRDRLKPERDQPGNWKLTVENDSESLHHEGVHPDTLQPIFPGELSRPVIVGDEPGMCHEHEIADDGVGRCSS
jgi:phenylpropionate dioxygenase-like ring-hydroxylating dioxygenase large terminal subunit